MDIQTRKISAFISGIVVALLAGIPPAYAQSAADEQWHYELTPYAWGVATTTTARLGPLSIDTSASFSDLLSNLDFALAGWFEARKGRWAVVFDGFYAKISDSKGNVEAKVTEELYGLGGAWRALEGPIPVDLIAGLRYNYIKPTIETPAISRSRSKDAFDPLIGVRGQLPLSQHWSLIGYGDVGTFNGHPYAWQLLAGANYAYSDTRIVKFGYRRYRIKFSENDFEIRNTLEGFYLGLGFGF